MAKSAKLHEVLAVESDLAAAAEKIMAETIVTFTKKEDHFHAHHKRLEMFDEARKQEEAGAETAKQLVDTVPSKLDYTAQALAKYWNVVAQKECTNQMAKADVVIDNVTVLADMPATFLLGMETKLKKLRAVLEAVPTHAPGVDWVPDPDTGRDVYKSKTPQVARREEKDFDFRVLYEATKEHPAQIEKWNANRVVGTYYTTSWTSTISPAQKSELLERCDTLIRAVKKARMRANETEVVKVSPGKALMDFVLSGKLGS
jgi:hypothetical protein